MMFVSAHPDNAFEMPRNFHTLDRENTVLSPTSARAIHAIRLDNF
jgi:hypothetical protein